jgi:hypothetical protein
MLTIRNGAALPSMAGQLGADWLLPAFLAPVLGGTLLTGGAVSVVGTLLGAVFVDVLTNGLYMLKVGEFWIQRRAVFDNFDDFRRLHPAFEALSVAEMAHATGRAPVHAGAARYYREHGWLPRWRATPITTLCHFASYL